MPTHSEAVRLNLEYYRKQAKILLKAGKAGESAAWQRLGLHSPKLSGPPALHDAQLTIAREQGFSSWPRFKSFIIESNLNFQELVAAFIDAATSDFKRAEEILTANPKIAGAGFYVALVLGDWKQVNHTLTETPALINSKSGPQNCEPLIYLCFSRYANGKSKRAADIVETARVLLRHGADPSTAPEVVLVNVTVPVGPPGAEELMVAVKVTGVPKVEVLGSAVTIVVEGQSVTV